MEHSANDFDSLPDLVSVLDSSSESSVDEDDDDDGLEVTYTDDIIIDNGGETEILTFMTAKAEHESG